MISFYYPRYIGSGRLKGYLFW